MVVVGSINADHLVRVDRLPAAGATIPSSRYHRAPGGKGLNQAVTAARQGADTVMVGAVGRDDAGWELLRVIDTEGIDRRRVAAVPSVATGVALVTVASDGANVIVVAAGANATVSPEQLADFEWREGDVALCQLEIPLSTVEATFVSARAAGAVTLLNPAPATGPLPASLLSLVDVLVPNEGEAVILAALVPAGDAVRPSGVSVVGAPGDRSDAAEAGEAGDVGAGARALVAAGAGTVIVTVGSRGSVVVGADGAVRAVPAHPVAVVDTTAAGDAYCGALAAALAGGMPLDEAVLRASAAGSLATTREGAVPSLPTAADVEALLAG